MRGGRAGVHTPDIANPRHPVTTLVSALDPRPRSPRPPFKQLDVLRIGMFEAALIQLLAASPQCTMAFADAFDLQSEEFSGNPAADRLVTPAPRGEIFGDKIDALPNAADSLDLGYQEFFGERLGIHSKKRCYHPFESNSRTRTGFNTAAQVSQSASSTLLYLTSKGFRVAVVRSMSCRAALSSLCATCTPQEHAITTPAQFVTQCVTNRERLMEQPHVPQVRRIKAAAKLRGQCRSQATQQADAILGPRPSSLLELHDVPPLLPAGEYLHGVHGTPCTLPCLTDQMDRWNKTDQPPLAPESGPNVISLATSQCMRRKNPTISGARRQGGEGGPGSGSQPPGFHTLRRSFATLPPIFARSNCAAPKGHASQRPTVTLGNFDFPSIALVFATENLSGSNGPSNHSFLSRYSGCLRSFRMDTRIS